MNMRSTLARWTAASDRARAPVVIAVAAALALGGFVLLLRQATGPSASAGPSPAPADAPLPAAIYSRVVCSFSNGDSRAALVQGADGGSSLVVGGRAYWLFGDTLLLPQSGKQIEQNSIAWSDGADTAGCPKLTYYTRDGAAAPFIEKDGSLTVWPSGAWPDGDGSFDFYTVYIYGSGPYAYWLGEVGVARLDVRSMRVTPLARKLWDSTSGFRSQVIGAQPVEVAGDGLLRVMLETLDHAELLARVPPGEIQSPGAYEYWDGGGWSHAPADAAPLWAPPHSDDPVQRLASFENGASVAWNQPLGRYVATVNTGFSLIGVRTAERLEGPWSKPQAWVDCLTFAEAAVPTCYSPLQHPELSSDGGRRIFVTLTRMQRYDVVGVEITLGTAVHEYRGADGTVAYAASAPGDGWQDQGIAFQASDAALPGFVPVYRWQRGPETRYAPDAAAGDFERGGVVFYAAPGVSVAGSATHYRPVYDWSNGTSHLLSTRSSGLEREGYVRGEAVFYAP